MGFRLYSVCSLLAVPICLALWRMGHWVRLPGVCVDLEDAAGMRECLKAGGKLEHTLNLRIGGNEDELEVWRPGSLFEWIAASVLFTYFIPLAWYFFKRYSERR